LEKVLAFVHKFPSYDANYVKCQTYFSWLRYTYINLLQYIRIPADNIDILCGYRKTDAGNTDTEARALCEEVRQRIEEYTENTEILKDYPYQFF
jgi:hypothetical protein